MKHLLGLVCLTGVIAAGSVFAQQETVQTRVAGDNEDVVAATQGARITAEKATVFGFGDTESVFSFEDAILETEDGAVAGITEGLYFPESRVVHVSGPLFLPATHVMSDDPVDDHDGSIKLTCDDGKMYRNGVPVGTSSICIARGARFTCDETGTGGTLDLDDPTCG